MTVSEVECVYVAKEGGQATTYDGLTSLEHLGSALSPETFSVVQSLLLHFTKGKSHMMDTSISDEA